jgi:hypothetical protein
MGYQKVIDKIQENNLSWNDIDRIELHEDTYEDFADRASFDTSDHFTQDAPAVRVTKKEEKIVYVSDNGMQVTINL